MRQQLNLSRSTASAWRNFRHWGCRGALLASLLLNASTDSSAQGIKGPQALNLGPAQQSGGRWYSKYVPWNKSSDSTTTFMPAKRRVTTVEEPNAAIKDEGQLSFARLAERRGQPEQSRLRCRGFWGRTRMG